MKMTINVPDNIPQAVILQQIAELEENLRRQAQPEVAGRLSQYAKNYIPTEEAKTQAWDAVINEKYHSS